MVDALETEGENISKLEKADILELTVRHLQRLQASRPSGLATSATPSEEASAESRWQSGFGHCATEACRFLAALPGEAAEKLARHLATGLQLTRQINVQMPPQRDLVSPTIATLEKTANLLVPCEPITSPDITTRRCSTPKSVSSYSGTSENTIENCTIVKAAYASPHSLTSTFNQAVSIETPSSSLSPKRSECPNREKIFQNLTIKISKTDIDEEEEIDVERVDEKDPMWRPW
ncbi:enhancer of split mbeta protein isoform X2 [Cephus cinctus]|nr:enhancer of split mbeta protein isoform X2 [Cephus cinctus]